MIERAIKKGIFLIPSTWERADVHRNAGAKRDKTKPRVRWQPYIDHLQDLYDKEQKYEKTKGN